MGLLCWCARVQQLDFQNLFQFLNLAIPWVLACAICTLILIWSFSPKQIFFKMCKNLVIIHRTYFDIGNPLFKLFRSSFSMYLCKYFKSFGDQKFQGKVQYLLGYRIQCCQESMYCKKESLQTGPFSFSCSSHQLQFTPHSSLKRWGGEKKCLSVKSFENVFL